jgi:tetratricopeptide (TPR) repeat protein
MTTRKILIHDVEYIVKEKEFLDDTKYTPLVMRKDLSQMDREIYVLRRLGSVFPDLTFVNYGVSHGEYVYKNVSEYFGNSMVVGDLGGTSFATNNLVLRVDTDVDNCKLNYLPLVIVCSSSDDIEGYRRYRLGERYLFVRGFDVGVGESKGENDNISCDKIIGLLRVDGVDVDLDNLLHVIYMIKDSGDGFRDVLMKNFRYVDRVTILDTGSTDNTLRVVADVIRELGCEDIVNVYEESFIDFGASRNRLMDLADNFKVGGEVLPKCAFQMMLDDTYVIEDGDKLRSFLTEVRCDDEAPSLSIYITGVDVLYSSIRLFRPESGIRYKYKIHEIPDCDTSALIPQKFGFINDIHSDYMRGRTVQRKDKDLELLFEEHEKDPDDPRILYYIAETYIVMEDWNNAFDYYNKRVLHRVEGFNEEKYDAMYKAAVMADLHLGYYWNVVMGMYIESYRYDTSRPESFFMIGSHYYNNDVNYDLAYMFLKKAFEIGLPLNSNMNFKIDQYNYYLPKWLIQLCYVKSDPTLGMLACERMLSYKPDWNTGIWHNIFWFVK